MVDTLTPEQRSVRMAAIKSQHTKPELAVRSLTHRLGYRFRIGKKTLPGKPDLVFPGRKKVVFVHGCFWHQHQGCKVSHLPKSRSDFWEAKFKRNVERDAANLKQLDDAGWKSLVVWECEVKDTAKLTKRLLKYLGPQGKPAKVRSEGHGSPSPS